MSRPALFVALLGCVAAANAATTHLGLVTALVPGLLVTAGTYTAGLTFGVRDALHDRGGLRWVLAAVAAGIGLSLLLGDGRIALASALAFGLAELADLAVYAPLRRRSWRAAVIASNAVAAVIDTLLFLAVAGFPITGATVAGQLLVKAVWCTAAFLLVAEVIRRAVPRERVVRAGA